MEEIIDSTQLEFDKSSFVIDLIQYKKRSMYIEITQAIFDDYGHHQFVKINPTNLNEILVILERYKRQIPSNLYKSTFSETDQDEVQKRYLRGVSLKDLSLQFNKSVDVIESTLISRGIKIVSNQIPKKKYYRKRYR